MPASSYDTTINIFILGAGDHHYSFASIKNYHTKILAI